MIIKAKIYRQSKSAMQSGRGNMGTWVLEHETTSARTPDDLTGWTSSCDTLNQIKLTFPSVDAAIEHAERKGWEYSVLPAQERIVKARNYGDNFKYFPPKEKSAK